MSDVVNALFSIFFYAFCFNPDYAVGGYCIILGYIIMIL